MLTERYRDGVRIWAPAKVNLHLEVLAKRPDGYHDLETLMVAVSLYDILEFKEEDVPALGAELGSDVTFFFSTPAAWCTGRGERVTTQPLGRPLWLVLLCPPFGLATADVYRGVRAPEQAVDGTAIRQAVAAGEIDEIGRRLHNRLQTSAEQ